MPLKDVLIAKIAGNLLIAGLILLAVFHALVLAGVLPSDIVWAGRAAGSGSDLYLMEGIALAVTLLFLALVAIRLGYLWPGRMKTVARVAMWVIAVFFVLSAVGNLTSEAALETFFFAPLALVLTVLAFGLAVEKGPL